MTEPSPPHFLLTNHGPGRLDDVWLKETVFLVDSEGIHECSDVPHFEYIYYRGSISSMDSLGEGEQKKIRLDPCWRQGFDLFSKKFPGTLLSRFRLTGVSLSSPEFQKDFFFIIDRGHAEFISADEYVGGKDLMYSVIAYTMRGPKSIIRWVSINDFHDFFKNPPQFFHQTEDGKYTPWYGSDLPPVAIMPIYFSRHTIIPPESGSVKLIWECKDEVGPAAVTFMSQPGVW
jgi:hypothetical protein